MAEFKLVIADPKTGKSYKHEVKDKEAGKFIGMKIGEKISGESIGIPGYEFEITGGSDYCGFPMRKDLDDVIRKKIYSVKGKGIRDVKKGERLRKSVCGNSIHVKISQINIKILKYGKSPLP
ncbi:MAG: 30S ribosomal protein S6e, partial [Candidatus Woesearchaeota archaeon]|nr:30S ribosomal protein S6e [Candidatus Woesearchaeota archaeon]